MTVCKMLSWVTPTLQVRKQVWGGVKKNWQSQAVEISERGIKARLVLLRRRGFLPLGGSASVELKGFDTGNSCIPTKITGISS